ncbi:hypothetical protein GCM10011342_03220 [Aquisalinus flavus]|uniref:Uncharacterized protein n=1 Tax=Aquisalinus flavus TaxID=1526572 RepID=A0A8J2Y757_9PROT|nr:hypothetical protein GCM10011342_03220 [Aquisalinus flavus]
MPAQGRRRIAIERRADLAGKTVERNVFGVEDAVAVFKMMHRAALFGFVLHFARRGRDFELGFLAAGGENEAGGEQ